MKKILSVVLLVVSASSCSDGTSMAGAGIERDTASKIITPPGSRSPVTEKEYNARGISYFVREDKSLGASVSRITILAKDSTFTDSLNLGDKDPVETCLIADLDEDHRDELYVITRSVGTGTFAHVFGFMRDEQNKLVAIEVPEISPMDQATGKLFEGYMGHDSIYISKAELIRSFPVFRPGDSRNEPSGGRRRVTYELQERTLVPR